MRLYKFNQKCRKNPQQNTRTRLFIYIAYLNQLKIIFYLEEFGSVLKVAEAEINVSFYINNQLPSIVDKAIIQNRFDENSYVDFTLQWKEESKLNFENQIQQQSQIQNQNIEDEVIQSAEQSSNEKLLALQTQENKFGDLNEHYIFSSYSKWRQYKQQQKLQSPRPKLVQELNEQKLMPLKSWEESLRNPDVKFVNIPLEKQPQQKLNNNSTAPRLRSKEHFPEKQSKQVDVSATPLQIKDILAKTKKEINMLEQEIQIHDQGKDQLSSMQRQYQPIEKQIKKQLKESQPKEEGNHAFQKENQKLKKRVETLKTNDKNQKQQIINLENELTKLKEEVKKYNKMSNQFQIKCSVYEKKIKEIENIPKPNQIYKKYYEAEYDEKYYKEILSNKENEIQNLTAIIQILESRLKANQTNQQNESTLKLMTIIKEKDEESSLQINRYQNEIENQKQQFENQMKAKEFQISKQQLQIEQLQVSIQELKKNEQFYQLRIQELENRQSLQQPASQIVENFDQKNPLELQKAIANYQRQINSLQEEISQINCQKLKLSVLNESITQEYSITKDILSLNEERQKQLESQLFLTEEDLILAKQNLADALNAAKEFGGNQLLDRIEKAIMFNKFTR